MKLLGILAVFGIGAILYWVFSSFDIVDIFTGVFIVGSLSALSVFAVAVLRGSAKNG